MSGVRVAIGVIRQESRWVVFDFHGGFADDHKRPSDCEVALNFPLVPNSLDGLPCFLRRRAIKEAVLRGFLIPGATNLAMRGNAHDLEPGANRESLVEG